MKDEIFDLEKIEALMLHKAYDELTDDERRLVDMHISSASEYNDMRETLLNVKKTFDEEKITLRPQVNMKESLLKKFEAVHGTNSSSIPPESQKKKFFIPVYMRYAGVAAVLVVGLFMVFTQYNAQKKSRSEDIVMYNAGEKNGEEKLPVTKEETVSPVENTEETAGYLNPTTMPTTTKQSEVSEQNNNVLSDQQQPVNNKVVRPVMLDELEEKDADEQIMVSDDEEFYTITGESTNMYYDYTTSDRNENKSKKKNTSLSDKNDNTSITGKSTRPPVNSTSSGSGITQTVTTVERDGLTKKELRKSLIYTDL